MKTIDSWPYRTDVPPLNEEGIHVWRISLSEPDDRIEHFRRLLSEKEIAKSEQFLFADHRRRFIVGRGQLRTLLGRYVERSANQIEFAYTGLGKPSIAHNVRGRPIAFNFTNSSDLAMLAVTSGTELGVDIERIRKMSNMEGLARRFFAHPEIEAITAQGSDAKRRHAFFRCWTRKEAFLKAIGKGLTFPLDKVCVTIEDTSGDHAATSDAADTDVGEVRIQWIDADNESADDWRLRHIEPAPDFVGALARKDVADDIQSWHWAE